MPTPLKPEGQRARRNKTGSEAILATAKAIPGPELPERPEPGWHPQVVEWWEALRRSPMAARYAEMDWHQALDLAKVRDMWERAPSAKLLAMVQKLAIGLGLDNADRRRNGWKMPVEQHMAMAEPLAKPDPPLGAKRRLRDPRRVLRAVSSGRG